MQMWVVPDEDGIKPGYEQLEIDDELLRGGLVPVASGRAEHQGAAAIRIGQRTQRCTPPGGPRRVGRASRTHRSCTSTSRDGSVDLEGTGPLEPATRPGSPAAPGSG